MSVCVCADARAFVRNISVRVYACTYVGILVHSCMCVCMYLCMYVCRYVCMYVYIIYYNI